MSERVRATKRKIPAAQDEARAAETRCELEKSKERFKKLHVMTCAYAQEIVDLKNQVRVLRSQMKDLCEMVAAESLD